MFESRKTEFKVTYTRTVEGKVVEETVHGSSTDGDPEALQKASDAVDEMAKRANEFLDGLSKSADSLFDAFRKKDKS